MSPSDQPAAPVTCFIRYRIDLAGIEDFERYARAWTALIERHGGRQCGFFLPTEGPETGFSFPGVGREGPDDVAIAMYSFPSEAAYHAYRRGVAEDPDCAPAAAIYRDTGCFLEYERSFVRRIEAQPGKGQELG